MVLQPIGFRLESGKGGGDISPEPGAPAPPSGNDRSATWGGPGMSCEELDQLIDSYLDRELDPSQSGRLEQHLSDCPTCRSLLQECLDFRSFFRSNAPTYPAPPQLRAKVLANIRRERLKAELTIFRRPWVYAAAALVLGLSALTILIPDNAKELSRQAVTRYTQS